MKKLYYRILLTVIVLACLMPFVMRDRNGYPLMTVDKLKLPDLQLPNVAQVTGNNTGDLSATLGELPGLQAKKVQVYRWQDDVGVWHYSDKENPAGMNEVIEVDVATSSTQMTNQDAEQQMAETDAATNTGTTGFPLIPLLNAGNTLQQARDVEKLLQQRHHNQERMINQR